MKADVKEVVTLWQSLDARLKYRLHYAKGCDTRGESEAGFAEALAAANKADVVLMALGEAPDMSGEAESRAHLDLPGVQLKLLKAVVATGKPVVLILFSGRPLAIPWEAEHLPSILAAWFPGVQAGPALVRTLYGDANPSGKLTATFPRSVGQEPLYYNHFNTGRPAPGSDRYVTGYIDEQATPQFPFGWGLSYTKFKYSPTAITSQTASAAELNRDGTIVVEATVTNTGQRRCGGRAALHPPARHERCTAGPRAERFRENHARTGRVAAGEVHANEEGACFLEHRHASRRRAGRIDRVDRTELSGRASGEVDDRAVTGRLPRWPLLL